MGVYINCMNGPIEKDDEYEILDENETLLLKARVLSQRKALLGRPVAHGIKII